MRTKAPRYDRRIDGRPCSDVDRCDVVRRPSEAALLTFKLISTDSVALALISASGTGSGSSSRVDCHDGDARQSRLVLDETPQLTECPRLLASTLSPPNRCPTPDALQILEDYHTVGVLGFGYQLLGYDVINISGEPSLLARETLEMLPGTLGTAFLEGCPVLGPFTTDPVDGLPAVGFSLTVHGEVDNAEVDTECSDRLDLLGLGNINDDAEVEYVVYQDEIGLSTDSVEAALVIFAYYYRHDDTTIECQYGDSIELSPGEDALIVDHGTVGLEVDLDGLVTLVGLADLRYGSHDHLGREGEHLPDLVVDERLELDLVCDVMLERNLANVVAGFVERLHGTLEGVELLWCRTEFYLERKFHYIEYSIQSIYNIPKFLPRLKPWDSLGAES